MVHMPGAAKGFRLPGAVRPGAEGARVGGKVPAEAPGGASLGTTARPHFCLYSFSEGHGQDWHCH